MVCAILPVFLNRFHSTGFTIRQAETHLVRFDRFLDDGILSLLRRVFIDVGYILLHSSASATHPFGAVRD